MTTLRRKVLIRVDGDVVEVVGVRFGRPLTERWDVAEGEEVFGVLDRAVASSRLLRPGRACEIGIRLESARTRYRTVQGEDDARSDDGGFEVLLPEVVGDVLEPILARRRVHGQAWFAAGPASRAFESLRERAQQGAIGRGLIVDRSSVAITVLLIDGATIRWARGAAATDAPEVAAMLLRRAADVVDGAYGLHWWHLTDVASPEDERRRRRDAREFEARCHALVGHLPRLLSGSNR